jgi:hypothetical protein
MECKELELRETLGAVAPSVSPISRFDPKRAKRGVRSKRGPTQLIVSAQSSAAHR